ncbi:hypothetical protein EIP86_009006 [Pleurotus ostreatoroseus]|nr:hypothetical protein EIP86_009006 [Pleurotus ostreatoroseus]
MHEVRATLEYSIIDLSTITVVRASYTVNFDYPKLEDILTRHFIAVFHPIHIASADEENFDSPMPSLRNDRPALLISSTSWTPDEDFSILLDALSLYDEAASKSGGKLPKVLMVVTGKGPDRAKYMKQVEQLQKGTGDKKDWAYVRLVSMWLEAADYPLLLGSADIGISLHSSSSALDLPMKIVDMFGCGLPACALNFACLDELVKNGINGLVFEKADQLAKQLETLLTGFPSSPTLDSLRASLLRTTPIEPGRRTTMDLRSTPPSFAGSKDSGLDDWEWSSWTQNWNQVMRPLLLTDVHSSEQ